MVFGWFFHKFISLSKVLKFLNCIVFFKKDILRVMSCFTILLEVYFFRILLLTYCFQFCLGRTFTILESYLHNFEYMGLYCVIIFFRYWICIDQCSNYDLRILKSYKLSSFCIPIKKKEGSCTPPSQAVLDRLIKVVDLPPYEAAKLVYICCMRV